MIEAKFFTVGTYLYKYNLTVLFVSPSKIAHEKFYIYCPPLVKTGQRRVDPSAVIFIRQRQNQTGNGQRAITGISEAEQRRKQYQAGVGVTSTGSEFQGKAVRDQTQK